MIFTLSAYNDLGKCSMGTNIDVFDTDKMKIFYNDKPVEINKVEDLFPFLWNIPGASTKHEDEHTFYFYDKGYWWWHYYQNVGEQMYSLLNSKDRLVKQQMSKRRRENNVQET